MKILNFLKAAAISGVMVISTDALSSTYDLCQDILRDGVRDEIAKQDSLDKRVATHNQFCSIAQKHDLNESNFSDFVKDKAKNFESSASNTDAGASVGWGPFSFDGNYGNGNSGEKLSEHDREKMLIDNKKSIIDYYNKNCGNSSYEESLKAEAALLSKIANPNIVEAWRQCMLNQNGFFAHVVENPAMSSETEIEYDVVVSWKSTEATAINSLKLRYKSDKVDSPYDYDNEHGSWLRTVDICEYDGFILRSGGTYPLSVTHRDLTQNTAVRVMAKTDTGVPKAHVVVLPKKVIPQPVAVSQSYAKLKANCDCGNNNEISVEDTYTDILPFVHCPDCGFERNLQLHFKNKKISNRGIRTNGWKETSVEQKSIGVIDYFKDKPSDIYRQYLLKVEDK